MRVWFDTEFYEDGRTIELISIGAVREDGAEYYAETDNAVTLADSAVWLRENVLPHLRGAPFVKTRADIASDLIGFCVAHDAGKPEWWAYYADYDWVVLCQLFGRMIDLPRGWPMYCRDLKQLADDRGGIRLPERLSSETNHDALADAKWCRRAHLWLLEQRKEPNA